MMRKVAIAKALTIPLPKVCSDDFASGWALADGHIHAGKPVLEVPPESWHLEKAQGYQHRLAKEVQDSQ